MNLKYLEIALEEAKKSYNIGDVPVGAVIIKNDKIISCAHNEKEHKQNPIKHAEIIAIEKACKKIKNWRLDDCEIYVTMEPCIMCCGAILQSRIKKIVYCTKNSLYGGIKTLKNEFLKNKIEIVNIKDDDKSKKLLKEFFKTKR